MLKDQIAGKNSSWAIRWYASAFLNERHTLYPGKSLVFHSGNDGSGTNVGVDSLLDVELSHEAVPVRAMEVRQDETAFQAFAKVYRKVAHPPLLFRIKRKIHKILSGQKSRS
jgi:hypothetical protein